MGFWRKGKVALRVVLASTNPRAIEALTRLRQNRQGEMGEEGFDLEVIEALTTQGVYSTLSKGRFHLVVVDLEQLPETELSRKTLKEILDRHNIPYLSGEEFALYPDRWKRGALLAAGIPQSPPARVVGLTSYSGGVGKTTVSLDGAVRFAQQTHLPVAVIELCHGVSGLAALTQTSPPFLHRCALQGGPPLTWRGVTLVPLDYGKAHRWEPTEFVPYLGEVVSQHILTLVDVRWPHDLLPAVWDLVERWLILAMADRLDTLANALRLEEELKKERGASTTIVVNRCHRASRLFLSSVTGIENALRLGEVASPSEFTGTLGERLLPLIYPDWRRYESSGFRRSLGHLLGRRA